MIHSIRLCFVLLAIGVFVAACGDDGETTSATAASPISIGVAAIKITPYGQNPDWGGAVTVSGIWGEEFTDDNGNGRYDRGEHFVDDPFNGELDHSSGNKYNGIYMAGFGENRIAKGILDDLWARALVIQGPHKKIALVSVDSVGEVKRGAYYGFAHAEAMVDPALKLDAILYSSTHDHQSPDALGLWGPTQFDDGKFPRYLQFIDKMVARAINQAGAAANMKTVNVIAASSNPHSDPTLLGLQVRTGCRPPWFFDEELRALQFVGNDGATVATLINWATHPESLESKNEMISSDFPHFIRQRVEQSLGGTAVYFSGDLGAAEIVGDTCVGNADKRADGTNEFDTRDTVGYARTGQIGNLVGDAVLRALAKGDHLDVADVEVKTDSYYIPGSNDLFAFANQIGLLDLDMSAFDVSHCPAGTALCAPVDQHLLTLKDRAGKPLVQLLTIPGEIFPELVYGISRNKRTDCPAADTGAAHEPAIADAMSAKYKLFLGLSPDELGYIVPGYDFYAPPSIDEEATDVCKGHAYDESHPGRTSPSHYHESLSLGLNVAASVNCHSLKLLGKDADAAANGACQRVGF